jgi:hypothetical protein
MRNILGMSEGPKEELYSTPLRRDSKSDLKGASSNKKGEAEKKSTPGVSFRYFREASDNENRADKDYRQSLRSPDYYVYS